MSGRLGDHLTCEACRAIVNGDPFLTSPPSMNDVALRLLDVPGMTAHRLAHTLTEWARNSADRAIALLELRAQT